VARPIIIAAIFAASLAAAPAGRATSNPSQTQIQQALARAKRSRQLWATINICASGSDSGRIGIRGQMPALGFPSTLFMRIQVEYWSPRARRFKPVPDRDAKKRVRLGGVTSGFEQGGHTFTFAPHAGLLRATVTFQWWGFGRLLGSAIRNTRRGHPDADGGQPRHFSAGLCALS
jgi:hypothetical protein